MTRMTHASAILAIALMAGAALADEIILRDGKSGKAEVVETTVDSIKVKASIDGGEVTATIKAAQLDPHCFYDVRRRHMEDTVEDHLQLAKFCILNEMFHQAKAQIDQARAIDEKAVEDAVDMPGVREGIARRLVDYSRKLVDKGDFEEAEKWISVVLTKGEDTDAAKDATGVLDSIEGARARKKAEEEHAAAEAAAAEQDEAAREAARKRNAAIAPLTTALTQASDAASKALRERNTTNSKKGLEAAAGKFEAVIDATLAMEVQDSDPAIADELAQIVAEAQAGAAKAYINAGEIALSRNSFKEAMDIGIRAQDVDPDNAAAASFVEKVRTYQALSSLNSRRR